ncbi:amidohydrolase [Yinghuangia seranimata]|uniref:amidohydrolase n=1 Tax=Yinghuangia seranimata TaxID=408067 RepID=UPI00248BC80A|nr:amidohydrolase [Yinghuangia seranimata]MDI2126020.1 amidohydrolase [Yinghuangia seranimata]
MSSSTDTSTSLAADLVIVDARVLTQDPARPVATAVAVRDGRILAVGDDADVRPHIGARTEVVRAAGHTVTPGLIDCHQHPVLGSEMARGADLVGADTLDELRVRLAAHADTLGPDGWVVGYGGEYGAFAGTGVGLHRDLIDEAVGGRPAFLWMSDAHSALMSTEGLRRAGITGPREFEDRAEIVCDDRGPTGELHEQAATSLGHSAVPPMDGAELAARVEELFAQQAALGVTGVHVLDDGPGTAETLTALNTSGRLGMRVRWAPWCPPGAVDNLAQRISELRAAVGDGLLRLAAVKFFADGAIDGGGAWLHEPDCCGQSHRSQWKDVTRYADAVAIAAANGLPAWTHAIGDKAVAHTLDTYAHVPAPHGTRHRVEHAEVLQDAEIGRFAALDVVASMQPTHMDWSLPDHSDNWSTRVGPERCALAWRYGDILRAGGHVALGSDWPVAAFDPRRTLAGAQLRRPAGEPSRAAYGPEQAVSAGQALAGYTTEAAYAAGESTYAGQVKAGYHADLTVFADDPTRVTPDDVAQLPVAATLVAGRFTYRAGV